MSMTEEMFLKMVHPLMPDDFAEAVSLFESFGPPFGLSLANMIVAAKPNYRVTELLRDLRVCRTELSEDPRAREWTDAEVRNAHAKMVVIAKRHITL